MSSATDSISEQYGEPGPAETNTSWVALKGRIRHHYELASDYYYSLWGEHIHHGYFLSPEDTKEKAQTQLIELLLQKSQVPKESTIVDVGCGIGGTSRYLAVEHGCQVIGITISGRQVELAQKLSLDVPGANMAADGSIEIGAKGGSVRFVELDAEKMAEFFDIDNEEKVFDAVWISEAMSHLPDKELFFRNAQLLLKKGGKLVIADWFKNEGLGEKEMEADIKPIEDGMLLPPLCTQTDYVRYAEKAGLQIFSKPFDISKEVSKTWDISWSLVQNPALWAFAITQGRDGLAFLQSFRAMRRGFANGNFRYAVLAFEK